MRRMIEGWTEVGWVILLVGLLLAGTIGSGLLLAHAGSGTTTLPTADPQTHAGPADQTTAPAAGTASDFPVGLDSTGSPMLLP
jgi:hypothetical protein